MTLSIAARLLHKRHQIITDDDLSHHRTRK